MDVTDVETETMGCGPSSVKRDTDELDRSCHPSSRENSHTARIDGFPFLEYMQSKPQRPNRDDECMA